MILFRPEHEGLDSESEKGPEASGVCLTRSIALQNDESRHLQALRLRPGDQIHLSDGAGRIWPASILSKKEVLIDGAPQSLPPPPPRLLAVSIPEGKRWDWLLQKAAELGVTHILPLWCARSEKRRFSKERSLRILKQACSQSRNLFLPTLDEPHELDRAFGSCAREAWQTDAKRQKAAIREYAFVLAARQAFAPSQRDCLSALSFWIGPEGGFTRTEEEFLIGRGLRPQGLGERILRIETAALVALARSLPLRPD